MIILLILGQSIRFRAVTLSSPSVLRLSPLQHGWEQGMMKETFHVFILPPPSISPILHGGANTIAEAEQDN